MSATVTNPQARFLTDLMRGRTKPIEGASRWRMVRTLQRRGLVAIDPVRAHGKITLDGLKALRGRKASQWAKDGCEAYRLQLDELDAAIAKATEA